MPQMRLFLLTLFITFSSVSAADRPNFLFIIADDLRNELGCYGSEIAITPNLDALAESGVRFDRAYCQKAVCWPSRNSMISGLLPGNLGKTNSKATFRESHPDITSLPQHFKENGYFAASFGKILHNGQDDPASWSQPHFDPPPLHYARPENRDKHPIINRSVPENKSNPLTEEADVPDNAYEDGATAEKAIEEIRKQAEEESPFFLMVGFHKPHSPFNAPKRDWDLYAETDIPLSPFPLQPKGAPVEQTFHPSSYLRSFAGFPTTGEIPKKEARKTRHAYLACVSYIDRLTGKLVEALEKSGQRENTIIIFTSDHGYHLGDHGLWSKHTTFELATRVPLLLTGPGISRNTSTNALVELLDLYPTLAGLASLDLPDHLEGQSFASVLSDPSATAREAAFSEFSRGGARGLSIRTNHFRYTEWCSQKSGEIVARELYDLHESPVERENLASDPELADLVGDLSVILKRRLSELSDLTARAQGMDTGAKKK
ncbi:MAG: sulfatase [Verrucomicrobiota bacterium]